MPGPRRIPPRALRTLVVLWLAAVFPASAQFSPGPLSSAHRALEGTTNCTKCHEVGKEIAGSKCLGCHAEIGAALERNTGYHALSAGRLECVSCHKEHLGADAKTYLFDPETFDHDLTGFTLTGRHDRIACAGCHKPAFIREALVQKRLERHPRQTYLGLRSGCAECHSDVHRGKFGPDCSTCHRSSGWRDVGSFDHGATNFPLVGKHAPVACAKCHPGAAPGAAAGGAGAGRFGTLPAESYADCAPCHASPHGSGVVSGACSGCHTAEGWGTAMRKPFDHARTRFPLEGGHARVECPACHAAGKDRSFERVFRRPFGDCTDCHADRHDGAFAASYDNDCARCHTVRGFSPSTFTLARHQQGAWPLTGAHIATPCVDCHRPGAPGTRWNFALENARCETCHEDAHEGQFAAAAGAGGCASCHTTTGWEGRDFAHERLTSFPLEGKHAPLRCGACHKELSDRRSGKMKFAKLERACESCHRDPHRAQFASGGKTDCARCHAAGGWALPAFNHETGSSFSLSGAHARVACAECHRREGPDTAAFTRYRPLASDCESCHQSKGRL